MKLFHFVCMETSKITFFQTELRREAELHTMQGLAKMCGVPRANLSHYVSGRTRPSVDALEALAKALPPRERGPLILAHLLDECPAAARRDLILELRPHLEGEGLAEAAPAYGEAPDMDMDALFAALRHLAETRPEVREWLQQSLRLIQ